MRADTLIREWIFENFKLSQIQLLSLVGAYEFTTGKYLSTINSLQRKENIKNFFNTFQIAAIDQRLLDDLKLQVVQFLKMTSVSFREPYGDENKRVRTGVKILVFEEAKTITPLWALNVFLGEDTVANLEKNVREICAVKGKPQATNSVLEMAASQLDCFSLIQFARKQEARALEIQLDKSGPDATFQYFRDKYLAEKRLELFKEQERRKIQREQARQDDLLKIFKNLVMDIQNGLDSFEKRLNRQIAGVKKNSLPEIETNLSELKDDLSLNVKLWMRELGSIDRDFPSLQTRVKAINNQLRVLEESVKDARHVYETLGLEFFTFVATRISQLWCDSAYQDQEMSHEEVSKITNEFSASEGLQIGTENFELARLTVLNTICDFSSRLWQHFQISLPALYNWYLNRSEIEPKHLSQIDKLRILHGQRSIGLLQQELEKYVEHQVQVSGTSLYSYSSAMNSLFRVKFNLSQADFMKEFSSRATSIRDPRFSRASSLECFIQLGKSFSVSLGNFIAEVTRIITNWAANDYEHNLENWEFKTKEPERQKYLTRRTLLRNILAEAEIPMSEDDFLRLMILDVNAFPTEMDPLDRSDSILLLAHNPPILVEKYKGLVSNYEA